eukprot:jgi/Tetstr1/429623/TSEL_019521.t1
MTTRVVPATVAALAVIILASANAQDACPCTLSYAPVCNPSGEEFSNKQCAVDCQGQDPALLCPCMPPVSPAGNASSDPCLATADWAPVCDENGTRVAPNQGTAICAGYTAEQLTPCQPVEPTGTASAEGCVCTLDYAPVCDCTGFLLAPNACSAECLGFEPEQFRPCAATTPTTKTAGGIDPAVSNDCVCATIYEPVCDQYGKEVAPSACNAECDGIEGAVPCEGFSTYVLPANMPKTDCMCTYEYAPVCAIDTDRQLGANACDAGCKGFAESQYEPCFAPVVPVLQPECEVCTLEFFPQCLRNGTEVGANPCEATCAGFAGEFLPCELVSESTGPSLVPSVLRPPCRCTKEYDPHCHVDTGALIGNNGCAATCNGYSPEEAVPCERNANGKPVLDGQVRNVCACPANLAPVCDTLGTELGANACTADCKGYPEGSYSEESCSTPTASCSTPCTRDYRPVCDMYGTQLGPNACEAACLGYNETDFSEMYCGQKHLLLEVLPMIAELTCACTREYLPQCDAQGTVVGANPCTARCAGYEDGSFVPCVFLELASSVATRTGNQGIEASGLFARLANDTAAVDFQVLCFEAPVLNMTRLCYSYNSSIGFAGERGPELSPSPPSDSGSLSLAFSQAKVFLAAFLAVLAAVAHV